MTPFPQKGKYKMEFQLKLSNKKFAHKCKMIYKIQ